MWLIVLCQCVYEKRLYESPSDSAIRLIKREKSFRLLTSRFSSSWQKKKKKRKKDREKRKKSERTREKENYERNEKRVKERGKRKTTRERKHSCVLYVKKEIMKSYSEKNARSFHPARFDHRNANCFHMCFQIWNFFSFLFFSFFIFDKTRLSRIKIHLKSEYTQQCYYYQSSFRHRAFSFSLLFFQ